MKLPPVTTIDDTWKNATRAIVEAALSELGTTKPVLDSEESGAATNAAYHANFSRQLDAKDGGERLIYRLARSQQQHTKDVEKFKELCNGAPLDRHEMLYMMRIMLDWARSSKCVPNSIRKEHVRWCQIYDQMAAFSRKHRNIVSIHAKHLVRLEEPSLLESEVEITSKQGTTFYERPFTAMYDKFRRKSEEEIRREINSQVFNDVTKSTCEAVNDRSVIPTEGFWVGQEQNDPKTVTLKTAYKTIKLSTVSTAK
ncbi:hypothetical protein Y032_0059g2963 [Ancylostoma ceylanicum]|uniref:Uncharacterized protein n=1 Tax=Ancylostoma ceylanicum TaxID=53326 RepID=A0A016U3T9_9BILA|nr:hypothetical protein Y032_0059g2963 [Ancylostoma ceylanicum]